MINKFRSSPIWLIGLFMIFAQAIAGITSTRVDGANQAYLVFFVIFYSTIVTIIFFIFLWFKPENFYGPSEYENISPESFTNSLRGLPKVTVDAVKEIKADAISENHDKLFSLIDSLLEEDIKQHLVFMRKHENYLDIYLDKDTRSTHQYEILMKNKSLSLGIFSPRNFINKTQGTDFIEFSSDHERLYLTQRGKDFSDWLIRYKKDAEVFYSQQGGWGERELISKGFSSRFILDKDMFK